jgi:hypothetical protein
MDVGKVIATDIARLISRCRKTQCPAEMAESKDAVTVLKSLLKGKGLVRQLHRLAGQDEATKYQEAAPKPHRNENTDSHHEKLRQIPAGRDRKSLKRLSAGIPLFGIRKQTSA